MPPTAGLAKHAGGRKTSAHLHVLEFLFFIIHYGFFLTFFNFILSRYIIVLADKKNGKFARRGSRTAALQMLYMLIYVYYYLTVKIVN